MSKRKSYLLNVNAQSIHKTYHIFSQTYHTLHFKLYLNFTQTYYEVYPKFTMNSSQTLPQNLTGTCIKLIK